jgi:L-fuculose-phosphate aldolase
MLPPDHPLLAMTNVVLTPHIGGATFDTEANHTRLIADDLARLVNGERPLHCEPGGTPMTTTADEVKAAVLETAKKVHESGLVVGTAGNISGKDAGRHRVHDSSSLPYEGMTVDDLVIVDLGETRSAAVEARPPRRHCTSRATSATRGRRCHPLARPAPRCSLVHEPIPAVIEEVVVYVGGEIPICDYKTTGTDELGDEVASKLADRSAALMANHGLVCIGKSPEDALRVARGGTHGRDRLGCARWVAFPIPDKVNANFSNVYGFIRGEMWGKD